MMIIRPMTIEDYDRVMDLLKQTPGVVIRDADSRDSIKGYLVRNPGLSFVAKADERIIGCIMSGHDGRRGYLNHLAVAEHFRLKGIGKALVGKCLGKLESSGISKSHIDVLATNDTAARFWEKIGWKERKDIKRYSIINDNSSNA